ncbi:ABC-2 type transport system ATP-binding protein [Frankineae bacterium MT45]|nr:ABC-2 type transport system ATP-binding protein [Frankineae bacterium MT45]
MTSPRPRRFSGRARAGWAVLRRHRGWSIAGALTLCVLLVAGVIFVVTAPAAIRTRSAMLPATPEASGPAAGVPVKLDTTLYFPNTSSPAPAILLAHGLGGTKRDLNSQAEALAKDGYVVLAYTARGFGASGGLVHLDAPAYEVADAKLLVSYLATLPQVRTTAPGDPVVGVAGASYGGGLALLLAGSDPRIDAVAADITWNSLQNSLFPNGAGTQPGVFKKLWTGYLFQSARGSGPQAEQSAACGRVAADVCAAFQQAAQSGVPNAATAALLAASSPASVDGRIKAPTLLSQGEQDSLFPLTEADANARAIAASGTPVRVIWRAGGHDAGGASSTSTAAAQSWFDAHLKGVGTADTSFELALQGSALSSSSGQRINQTLRATAGYPGVQAPPAPTSSVTLSNKSQTISAPAGGNPAAVSSLPGLGSLLEQVATLGAASGVGSDLGLGAVDGQNAVFDSPVLKQRQRIAGASRVRLTVTPLGSSDATLFVSLVDLSADGTTRTPAALVEPVQLTGLTPGVATTVEVQLPAIVTDIAAGHRIRLVVATTDLAYQTPIDPREYRIALASDTGQLTVPGIDAEIVHSGSALPWLIVGVIAMLLCIGWAVLRGIRRRRADTPVPELLNTPISVSNLVKEYSDGYRAVDGPSFTVERGQVVGLLGPNGAGKTTTLRVLVGLIRPTSGQVHVFGHLVTPGAPVLSRLGAFIEGPGFLPHLSGRENLHLFWAASGRDEKYAQFETALEIAGLGSSVDRKVKTYSQGMRQRLAIAQAMLGLPELLVLDEPTNGLDPPQIAEMREVLRSYADTGRTVVVSSHLLAEVEQTCTHVVVMHKGQLVAAGSVADIAGAGGTQLAVADPSEAERVLAAAGISTRQVPVRRALEDVFLDLVGGDDS